MKRTRNVTLFAILCLFLAAACSDDDDGKTGDGQVAAQDGGADTATPTEDGAATTEDGAVATEDGAATTEDTGSAASGSNGGCDQDIDGKHYCVDYVGSGFESDPAKNASKNACEASGGTWLETGCPTDAFQGYCTWFEDDMMEQRYYFYNYEAADLETEKTDCEANADRHWHDA